MDERPEAPQQAPVEGAGLGAPLGDAEPVPEPSALGDRAPDLEMLDRVEGELADVERALSRLDDGSYGTCEVCSGPIDDERLASEPAARLCSTHG